MSSWSDLDLGGLEVWSCRLGNGRVFGWRAESLGGRGLQGKGEGSMEMPWRGLLVVVMHRITAIDLTANFPRTQ